MKKSAFWQLGFVLTILCMCSINYGHELQDKKILKRYANLPRYRRDSGYTTLGPFGRLRRRTGGTPPYRVYLWKPREVTNMTGLSEVEIERLRGNRGNHSNLDDMGFKRVNYTRPTSYRDHLRIPTHTIWSPLTEVKPNSDEMVATLSALVVNEKKEGNEKGNEQETKEKEAKSKLEKEAETSGWKPRPLEIIVGALCGFLLVSITIVLLYRCRVKKVGKIEVTVSKSCAYRASTNEGFKKEIEEI